jgi:beta-galactosidase/beta-glucuronidase
MPVVEASSVAHSTHDDSRRTEVTIDGRHILVNGQPFTVRGVGYAPTPTGSDPEAASPYGDYFTPTYSAIPERDLPLLRAMGANTIRLWGWDPHVDHTGFLDNAYNGGSSPLYVIASFWFGPPRDISQPADRQALVAEFREMVALHKDHPAILMWAIGNELNAPWMFGDSDELFSLIDEMAQAAHEEEGPGYHPVTTPLADVDLLATIAARDAEVPHLDVWSVQPYRGASFGSLFDDYAAVSEKPLVITEYGIDAYDDGKGDEYEAVGAPYQALYAAALWGEVVEHANVCSGASIMEYSDEWWKGKHGIADASHPECPDLDPALHSDCGYAHSGHPDGYANEEWWGIMRTVDNGEQPDVMEPRTVYYTLQSLWLETSYLPLVLRGG